MRRPSITDYIGTLENPVGVFRTLGDVEVARDIYGELSLRAGNSAAIFIYTAHTVGEESAVGGEHAPNGGRRRFLKCYIRPNPHLRAIYAYVEKHRPPLLPEVRLLRDELYLLSLADGEGWVDVVEGEWTEGETLSATVARAAKAGDRERLQQLADAFDALCRTLVAQEWAHGDLKPENIIVRRETAPATESEPESAAVPILTLIDCDAMWIPELAGQKAGELGTPAYRHPARTAEHFGKLTDDYPMALISVSLHALALAPELYAKYNTHDTLLLSPTEVLAGKSDAHAEILELFADKGMAREYRMTETLASPFPDDINAARFFAGKFTGNPATPLESFVKHGKWGFTDASGNTIIAPFWDEALEFRANETDKPRTAKVRLAGKWHEIDKNGKKVF